MDQLAGDGLAGDIIDGLHDTDRIGDVTVTADPDQERVSFVNLAQDPKLVLAARAEAIPAQPLDAGHLPLPDPAVHLDGTTMLQDLHSLALSEYHINKNLADGIAHRVDASRRSVEKLLTLLQAVTTAEHAYARSMSQAATVDVGSADSDGEALQNAVGGVGELLALIGRAHTQVCVDTFSHLHIRLHLSNIHNITS